MKKITKKKLTKKLTAEEQAEQKLEKHWDQAEEASKKNIARLFDTNLPINFSPKDIDLEKSISWRMTARDSYEGVPALYQDAEELPPTEYLAEEIAYHYLLTVLKRFIDDLSEYDCHDPAYFEQLLTN